MRRTGLGPTERSSGCFELRIRTERALTACARLESYPDSIKAQHGSYPEAKRVCDLLNGRRAVSGDASREEAHRMEQ